jgi:hypothetical protein
MNRTYQKSTSGKSIVVREETYNALGLPTSRKTGIIRVKEGSDLDLILNHPEELDHYQFSKVQNKDNGLFEMEYAVATPVPAGEIETAD